MRAFEVCQCAGRNKDATAAKEDGSGTKIFADELLRLKAHDFDKVRCLRAAHRLSRSRSNKETVDIVQGHEQKSTKKQATRYLTGIASVCGKGSKLQLLQNVWAAEVNL